MLALYNRTDDGLAGVVWGGLWAKPHARAARVRAADIRTGSALLIAALTATGTTVISELSQLRRGHADLPGTLRLLGAAITSGKAPS